jgi:cell division septation protein DedD
MRSATCVAEQRRVKVQMMITVRARRTAVTVLIVALACIGGCSQEQQDWRAAESRDTTQSYGQFIERHPDSELVKQARARIAQLAEDRDWNQAGKADTAAAYEEFLARHPTGKWAQEARIRMQNFALGGAPAASNVVAPPAGGVAVPGEAATPPAPPPHGAAAPPSVARAPATSTPTAGLGGGFGIQLGAFSTEERANAEWQALEGRYAAQLHGLTAQVVAADTASGRIFRLQAQGVDEARARLICEQLRQLSQQCVPVVPH